MWLNYSLFYKKAQKQKLCVSECAILGGATTIYITYLYTTILHKFYLSIGI